MRLRLAITQTFSVLMLFFLSGCLAGGGVSGAENSNTPAIEKTETPTVSSTTPATSASNSTPTVSGTAEAQSDVEIYSDSSCSTQVATGTADSSGNFAISVSVSVRHTAQTYYARATASGKSISDCSTTSVSYTDTSIQPGMGVFYGNQTNAPSTPTKINQATARSLLWSSSEFDSNYFNHSTTTDNHQIQVSTAGDYFLSVTVPMEMTAGTYRPAVRTEVYINGVARSGAVSEGTYIRNDDDHTESSGHLALLLRSLPADAIIDVRVSETAGQDGSETVSIATRATLFLEYVSSSRNVFTGTATRTVGDTNLNQGASPLQWTTGREDSAFNHTNGSHEIALQDSGDYLVYFNIPINSTTERTSPQALIKLGGTTIEGGIAKQGYIRADSGHNDSSVHWFGIVVGATAGQILTVDMQQSAEPGSVITQSGNVATIMVEKITDTDTVIALRANNTTGGDNWNSAGVESIRWSVNDITNSVNFSHTNAGATNHEIKVNAPGDYLVLYTDVQSTSVQRSNPKVQIRVAGTDVNGAQSKSHYVRNSSDHQSSSTTIAYFLRGLTADQAISLTTVQEGNTGTVNDEADARLVIIKK